MTWRTFMWKPWAIRFFWGIPLFFWCLQSFGRQVPCHIYSKTLQLPQDNSPCSTLRRGFRLISRNRPKRAEALFRTALAASTQANNRFLEAQSYRGLSDASFFEGKYPASKAQGEKALKIFTVLNDPRGIALMHKDLGLIATQDGNRVLASKLLAQAYSEFNALKDDHDRLLVLLDQIHEWSSDADAEARIVRAAALAQALGDSAAMGRIKQDRGDDEFARGHYASALASYQQSLKLLRKSGTSRQRSYVLTSLGRLYRELNDPAKARKCYRAALRLEESDRDILGQLETSNAIAVSYDAQKRWGQATQYYRKVLVLARRTGSPRAIRFALGNLGGEYVESGEPKRAIPILCKVAAEENSAYIAAYRYHDLSKAYVVLGQYGLALKAVNKAVRLRRGQTDQSNLVDSLTLRAHILSRLGKTNEGLADTGEALQILEGIRSHLVPNDFLKRGFGDAEQRVYDMAVELRFSQGDFRSAAEAMEDGRSRAFLDLLATRESGTGRKTTTTANLQAAGAPLASVAVDSTRHTTSFSAADMAAAARRLHSTFISYWTTQDALYILVVSPAGKFNGVQVNVSLARLRSLIARIPGSSPQLGFALASGPLHGYDVWQSLYNLLIRPIVAFLPRRRGSLLTIIPHGPLFRLPFCALQDPHGHYLVEQYATHYVPAAAVLQFTRQSERNALARAKQFLLVSYSAPADMATGERPALDAPSALLWANDEVGAIHSLLKSRNSLLLENRRASVRAVSAAMERSTMIHVASHAEFNEAHPLASYLQLAPAPAGTSAAVRQGRLTAAEILDLHISANLVVLSACQTSAGRISGDGVLGMTRAFFAAGTASVIATQWAIADKPSDMLMTRFYRNLLSGMTKAEALRSAKLSLIEALRQGHVAIRTPLGNLRLPETPRFWAGFVLEGNP